MTLFQVPVPQVSSWVRFQYARPCSVVNILPLGRTFSVFGVMYSNRGGTVHNSIPVLCTCHTTPGVVLPEGKRDRRLGHHPLVAQTGLQHQQACSSAAQSQQPPASSNAHCFTTFATNASLCSFSTRPCKASSGFRALYLHFIGTP